MSRQDRAERTRLVVLEAAAEVFLGEGYANAALAEVIERSGVTKGALYFHFSSKEDLAREVLDAGHARLWAVSQAQRGTRPAIEELITLSRVTLDAAERDRVISAMLRLYREIGDFRGNEQNLVLAWQGDVAALLAQAAAEGDVVVEDTAEVAALLVGAVAGTWMVAEAGGALKELPRRLERLWYHLLPSLVEPSTVDFLRQYAARLLMR